MKTQRMYALILLMNACGCVTATIQANNWNNLFNGEDLTGWEQKNGSATFEAKDGMIVGTTAPGSPNSFLWTKEPYSALRLNIAQHSKDKPDGPQQSLWWQPAWASDENRIGSGTFLCKTTTIADSRIQD